LTPTQSKPLIPLQSTSHSSRRPSVDPDDIVGETKRRNIIKILKKLGLRYFGPGKGSHEIWKHPATGKIVPLPHSSEIKEGTRASIATLTRNALPSS